MKRLMIFFLVGIFFINFASAILWTDNTTAYWSMNESSGSVAEDNLGKYNGTHHNGNNGVVEDGNWSSGHIGNSIYFNGSQYVNITNNSQLDFTEFAVSFWYKDEDVSSNQAFIDKILPSASTHDGFQIYNTSGAVRFSARVGGTLVTIDSTEPIALDEWHHVLARWTGSAIELWIDGVNQSNTASLTGVMSSTNWIEMGRAGDDSWYYTGFLDEVAVFNNSLSTTDILQLYNNGNGLAYNQPGGLVISYLSPSDNSPNYRTDNLNLNVTFNATTVSSQGNNITNISLYSNSTGTWHLNQTQSFIGQNISSQTTTFYHDIPVDDSIIWGMQVCDEGGCVFGNNRTILLTEIFFTLCNATYDDLFINYTNFQDEGNLTNLTASIPNANFTYYLGDGSSSREYLLTDNTENPHYAFCASPEELTFNVDVRIQYEATGYPQRVFDPLVTSYTNTTSNQTLYLLFVDDGIYVTFQVINAAEQALSDVFVNATRSINSVQQMVGSGITDSGGLLTLWLNPDFVHNFVFSKVTYESLATSFAPTQNSYTISLGSQSVSSGANDYVRGITYDVTPRFNSPLFDNLIYDFNFTLTSTFWTVESFGFELWNTTTLLGSATNTSNGGTTGISFNVSNQNNLEMRYWWEINNTYMNASTTYVVLSGQSTQWSINNTITDFRTYLNSGIFGLDNFAVALLIFIVLLVSVGIMSHKFGLTSPTALSVLIFAIVLFLDVGLNLLATLNPFGINHFITIFTAFIMASLLMRGLVR